jgi:spore germination protein GerM
MKHVSNPIMLIGLGAWVLGILVFAIQPLPEISSTAKLKTNVYFPNGKLEKNAPCDKVYPIKRDYEGGDITWQTLTMLIAGPDENEFGQGYFSHLPRALEINELKIENGVAQIDLSDAMHKLKTNCRIEGALTQIKQTLLQTPKIKEVLISVEGLPASFLKAR